LYNYSALLNNRAIEIKDLLFTANKKLKEWFIKIMEYFSSYGLK